MKRFHLNSILAAILVLLMGSCGKNEVTLQGSLSGSEGKTLIVAHRAADKAGSFLIENSVPFSSGAFTYKAITRYPTVMWIMSAADGKLLMPIYGERGDELTISGKYSEPWAWKVEGNEVMRLYCKWAKANINALMSDDPAKINAAVAECVMKIPDNRAAAFILFTRFHIAGYEKQYKALQAALKLDKDALKEMQQACMLPPAPAEPKMRAPDKLDLYSTTDSLVTVKLKGKIPTLLYFWREAPDEQTRTLLKKALDRDTLLQTVAVYMNNDTVAWHRLLRNDSISDKAVHLHALGGEINPAVRPLAVPGTPYFIVTSKTGAILYQGTDASAASAKL